VAARPKRSPLPSPARPQRSRASGWEPIYAAARRIPPGRVASYGTVARLAGIPRGARQVGYALHALDDGSGVPWHRVVGADGRVKARGVAGPAELQVALLAREGVRFDASGRIDLARYGWDGAPAPAAKPSPRCRVTKRR